MQGWGELRQPRAPQPPQTQETSGEVPTERTNKQTSEGRGRARGTSVAPAPAPSQVPHPEVGGRDVGSGWDWPR